MAEATETYSRAGVRWYLRMAEAGIIETDSRAGVRWYLRIAEAELQRRAAVREYVGI
jgi:hypothetical protein